MAASIEYRGVSVRSPEERTILDNVSLSIAAGEAVAFIGRSGAGKTTALKLVNGLIKPVAGQVLVDGAAIRDSDLVAWRRRIGYVIQGVGLFPHRTVYENVAIVPRLLQWPEDQIRHEAREILERLELPLARYGDRYPRSLSGGEQQRVGIARATIARPAILLCDEPFSALDPLVRREQQNAFLAIRREQSATIVFVTHDLSEALRIAGRIILFDLGRMIVDLPAATFLESAIPLARRFVESASLPQLGSAH